MHFRENGKLNGTNAIAESTHTHFTPKTDTSYTVWLMVFGIILLGLAFRAMLLDAFFLNYDESMHFHVAGEATLADTWRTSRTHTHPPLIFLFYHLWMKLGDSETMLRLPSLLLSIPTLVFGFLWLRELLGPRPALVGLAILTFSVPMLQLGTVMRSYALMLAFMVAALYFQERFLCRKSIIALAGSGCCLALALLTHYSSVWLILVLGLLTILRIISGTLPRQAIISWVILQTTLLSMCVVLYFVHVRGFINSAVQSELWNIALKNGSSVAEKTFPLQFAITRVLDFFKYLMGPAGIPMAAMVVIGSLVLARKELQDRKSKWIAFERCMLVILPFIVAMLLFHFRIYPLGKTRHSIWLVPFVSAGIAAAASHLLSRSRFVWGTFIAISVSFWIYNVPFMSIKHLETTQTPAMLRTVATLLKEKIPKNALIVTDLSTRYVLEYYLDGRTIHGRPLGGGYIEYQMSGYRVVTIPKFHLRSYNMKNDWSNFEAALGDDATRPLWVAYIGFRIPGYAPEKILRQLPSNRLINKVGHLDNQFLNLQFQLQQNH